MCKIDCDVKTVWKLERNFKRIDKKDLQNLVGLRLRLSQGLSLDSAKGRSEVKSYRRFKI